MNTPTKSEPEKPPDKHEAWASWLTSLLIGGAKLVQAVALLVYAIHGIKP